ncbi:MAG TPA: efflux RND transporter permease subunit [Gemmatimonadales bacterium]|nr:efflux RND transporter permease subunit [Gemmatimonadales bacterium]
MNIARFAGRRRAPILFAAVLITAAGAYAAATLPAGIYPEATFPRIAVVAQGGTFEPKDMVVAVTRPLEEAVSGVIDLRRIRSRTVRGGAELSLDFRPGADMPYALQQVQARLSALQPSLPGDIHLEAERLTPSVFPMLQYELTGGDPAELRDLAEYTIRPRLARLPDVGGVEVQGGLVREVSVELEPAWLVARHVSASEVADRIAGANVTVAAGRVDREYRQYSVVVSGLLATPDAVAATVVREDGPAVLRVGDLGRVHYGVEDRFQLTTGNGAPAALINVSRQPQGSILRVEDAVQATVDSLRPELPAGVRLESVYDQGALVRESIATVRDAMVIGSVLAVAILFLFLGRVDLTLIAAITLPLAITGSFAGMAAAGDSINLMSMGGLAVAIGLVIDDAVVVVENIARRAATGGEDPTVVLDATQEILGPVAGSTATTVVVFAPLALLEGVVGQFFKSFAIALAVAVVLSLIYSISIIPILASRRRGFGEGHAAGLRLTRLEAGYTSLLRGGLRRPVMALGLALGLAALAVVAGRFIGTGFLPQMDEGGFILDYWTPTGTSLIETNREVAHIERALREDPAVLAFTRRTGAELGLFATSPNRGDMTVLLKPRRVRGISVYGVMDRLRDRLDRELPSVRIEYHQILEDLLGDLTGAPEPVEVKLFHPDVAVATRAAKFVAAEADSVPGLEDLFDGDAGNVPELKVRLDPFRVARLGLSNDAVAGQAAASLFGAPAGSVREPNRLVPIRVRLPDSVRYSPEIARTLPIVGPNGWAPLGMLGTVQDTSDASELLRENLRPLVIVTGTVDPERTSLGEVMRDLRSRLARLALPAGVTLEYGGQYTGQQESFRQLLLVLGLAVALVLLVMVAQFGAFRGPLVILAAATLGLTGALGGLALTHVPFNVSSFMGLILLVGLVVKNGILLLDAAMGFRAEGRSPMESLTEAGRVRLRPILMTTICTLAGLLPLALGLGAGAELQRPLAIAVIGGLSLSTVVTLLLLPVGLLVTRALDGLGSVGSER